jgi:hypothetical protein
MIVLTCFSFHHLHSSYTISTLEVSSLNKLKSLDEGQMKVAAENYVKCNLIDCSRSVYRILLGLLCQIRSPRCGLWMCRMRWEINNFSRNA